MKQIDNFKEFIDHHYYYVDKSLFIETVFNDPLTLFTRPRRFGKTLNMSMLYYFFSNKEKDNAYLFDGLKITEKKEIMKHQNQYPVIFMTFKDMKQLEFHEQISQFASIISQICINYVELLDSPYLLDYEKKIFNDYLIENSSHTQLQDSLLNISQYLEKHYHKKVILLIDEYDVPLQLAYLNDNQENNYYNKMSHFMSNVLSSSLKTNNALERGVLTGCLRITKESIFTGFNNFNVYSIFNKGLSSSHFGFTQKEVDDLLNDYHLEEYQDKMKEWYDGYLFGNTEIYNPWSTLKFVNQMVTENDYQPQSYWANTSGNDIVYQYIKKSNETMKQEFEDLVCGKAIMKTITQELTYRDMDDINHIYSFLLYTGYLKVKDYTYNKDNEIIADTYELVIPNKEVQTIYIKQFQNYFNDYTNDKKEEFVEALRNENVEKANDILNDILCHSISYYDNYESFYHGFMMGLLSGYSIVSNRESGSGRFDIGIKPNHIAKKYIVIECKKANSLALLIQESNNAVKQIIDKKYIEGIKNEGYLNVIGYGISFYKKSCWISIVK